MIDLLPTDIAAALARRDWARWRIDASQKALDTGTLAPHEQRAAHATIVHCRKQLERLDAWLAERGTS